MLLKRKQSVNQETNRPEKGRSFSSEGKKEGVWGRNFCLHFILSSFPAPPAPFRAAHFSIHLLRRAVVGRTARLHQHFSIILWKLASRTFKISPNFVIEGQPFRILRFCGRNFPRFFQAASHFLPPELKVRLRGAQSSAQWYDNFTIATEQPIFCISPKAQLPNFRKESDNFSVLRTVCPKAITT